MLHWFLKYLALGYSVIPLKPRSKEPLIEWKEFQTRRATEAEVRQWIASEPNAGVGVVTGKISNLAVVDLDGPVGLKTASAMSLKSSVVSISGNGRHLWYAYPSDFNATNAVKIFPGVDLRAEGGYIVAPPSVHPNGKRYRWLTNFKMSIQELPYVLNAETQKVIGLNVSANVISDKPDDWIAEALEEMRNGHVHNTLVSVLGKFRHHNFSVGDTIALLKPHAFENGQPFEGLEDKVHEIWNRYEPGNTKEYSNLLHGTSNTNGLVIHSPANTDSWKQFEQRELDYDREDSKNTIWTGYAKLDGMLKNGLKSSRLFVLAARTGVGKTNWIIGAAREICRAGKSVLLFSTEMPYEEIWSRYLATLGPGEEFRNHKFYVCDSFSPSLPKVEEAIAQVKPDLFIFDHINHVSEDARELGAFMQGLNWLKRKYECAGIVTSQLNRSADWVDLRSGEKVTPRLSMIKGSGTIEQAASRVLLLSETRVLPEYTEIIGNLDKNDNGPKGICHFGLFNNPWRMEQV